MSGMVKKGLIGIFVALLLLYARPALAAENFTIKNVDASKTAGSAQAARQMAIASAQVKAFAQLIDAIVMPEDKSRVPELSEPEIADLVSGYEVTEEKVGEKTYKARFHVTFDRKKVQAFLTGAGIEPLENVSPNMMVIPILQEGTQVMLWEKENGWKDAWANAASADKGQSVVVPLGDLEDITMVNVEDAFAGQFASLSKLAEKYDAGRILIAEAVYDVEPETKRPSLQVIMRLLQGESILDRVKMSFAGEPGEGKEAFLVRAARAASHKIAESAKSIAKASAGEEKQEQQLLAQVPIQDIAKWRAFQVNVRHIDGVKDMKVETISSNLARVAIIYTGDFSTLTYFLHNAGYSLTNNGDGTWWLGLP
jgi:hypothetical protein